MADDAVGILREATATDQQRDAAYQAYSTAKTWDDLKSGLDQSGLPTATKVALARAWAPIAKQVNAPRYGTPPAPAVAKTPSAPVPGAEQTGLPAYPKPPQPPLPVEMQDPSSPEGLMGVRDTGVTAGAIRGLQGMVRGTERMAEPTAKDKAGGAHGIISGAFDAATPFMAASGVTAPLKTAAAIVPAVAAQKGLSGVLKAAGVPEEYADLAGDAAALLAGHHSSKALEALRGKGGPSNTKPAGQSSDVKPATGKGIPPRDAPPPTPVAAITPEVLPPESAQISAPEQAVTPPTPAPVAQSLRTSDVTAEPPTPQASISVQSGTKVTPDRRRIQMRGAHDRVTVEFPDTESTGAYDAAAKAGLNRSGGQNPRGVDTAPLNAAAKSVASKYGIGEQDARTLLSDYHREIKSQVKEYPPHSDAEQTHAPQSLGEFINDWKVVNSEPPAPASVEPPATSNIGPEVIPIASEAIPKQTNSEVANEGSAAVSPEGGREMAQSPSPAGPTTEQSSAAPAGIQELDTDTILSDPARFQFKRDVGQKGVGQELKEVEKYDPELGGIISVWRDPDNGQVYVINGHHRLELAQRTGHKKMLVRFIEAADAREARAKGALINIAEGRGTSIDAAKLFRDMEITPDDLRAKGVSLRGQVAREGVAMSKLSQPIFERVLEGELPVGRAAMLGEALPDHAEQKAALELLDRSEKKGKRLTNDEAKELIRFVKTAPRATETNHTLFGDEEITNSLAIEKAEISSYIKQRLSQEKKLFSAVGSKANADTLGASGNVIKAEDNARVAEQVKQAQAVYDKLSASAGPISDVLDQSAGRLASGEGSNSVKEDAYRKVRDAVSETLSGKKSSVPGGLQAVDQARGGEAPESGAGADQSPLTPRQFAQQFNDELGRTVGKDRLEAELNQGRNELGSVEGIGLFDNQQGMFDSEPPTPARELAPSTKILHTFPGEDGTEAEVAKTPNGYSAILRDTDANKSVGGRIFPTLDKAIEHAKSLVAGPKSGEPPTPPKFLRSKEWNTDIPQTHQETLDKADIRRYRGDYKTGKPPRIYLNEAAKNIIDGATKALWGNQAPKDWAGVHMNTGDVQRMATFLKRYSESGLDKTASDKRGVMLKIAEELMRAAVSSKDVVLIRAGKDAMLSTGESVPLPPPSKIYRHEMTHSALDRVGEFVSDEDLKSGPLAKAYRAVNAKLPGLDRNIAVQEIMTYSLTGDWAKIGLTEKQAKDAVLALVKKAVSEKGAKGEQVLRYAKPSQRKDILREVGSQPPTPVKR